MLIHHENKTNVFKKLEVADSLFMKKWWLEHTFKDSKGRNLQFRGWINTKAISEEDFPEQIEGNFWVSKCEKDSKGTYRINGHFDIGFGEQDNYVFGSVYPIENINYSELNREKAMSILKALEPLDYFDKFEARIEDCLKLNSTYVDKVY